MKNPRINQTNGMSADGRICKCGECLWRAPWRTKPTTVPKNWSSLLAIQIGGSLEHLGYRTTTFAEPDIVQVCTRKDFCGERDQTRGGGFEMEKRPQSSMGEGRLWS